MKPQKSDIEYEKIDINDFVTGTIDEIQYEQDHLFKGFQGAEDKKRPAVRFKFVVNGYQHKHYSRWMTFSYGEKTNLYLKYLVSLVEGALPDMDFDLDKLKGMAVKMLWKEQNGFQSIETIRPIGGKLKVKEQAITDEFSDDDLRPDSEVPF